MEDLQRKLSPFIRQLHREVSSPTELENRLAPIAREVLDKMIDDKLLINDFNNDEKVKIPESYMDNHYSKFMEETFQGNRSGYIEFLKSEGLTDRSFREQQKEEVILSFLRSRLRKSTAEISPEQIRKYYDEHKDQFAQKEAVHLRQIMLRPVEDDTETSTALLEKANKIVAKLKSGQTFEDTAKTFSEDEMKASGGNWGWINRSDIRKELADVAFSLNKGTYSNPVILNNHAFVLYVEEKRLAGNVPISEVREQIENALVNESAKKVQAREVQKLRKKAHIKYFI